MSPTSSAGSRSTTTGSCASQVEVENERNPRQSDRAVRVELTAYSKGPVIRAEAAAVDKMGALDLAVDKMAAQMRRANDRRARAHRNRPATGELPTARPRPTATEDDVVTERQVGPITVTGDGPPVVREKTHTARPMTLDQALYEMELVGHDFYLYVDQETDRPAVVYRRRGLRLRRDLARRGARGLTSPAWPRRVRPEGPDIAQLAHTDPGS